MGGGVRKRTDEARENSRMFHKMRRRRTRRSGGKEEGSKEEKQVKRPHRTYQTEERSRERE